MTSVKSHDIGELTGFAMDVIHQVGEKALAFYGKGEPQIKFDEELVEMRDALDSGDRQAVEDELGDLLFVATNLARKLKIDPASALRRSNAKFERRFRAVEEAAGGQDGLQKLDLDAMESLWQEVKKGEKA